VLFFADSGEFLELKTVRASHPHRTNLERVNGIGESIDIARHGLTVAIGQEYCDLAFMEHKHRCRVKAGSSFAVISRVPRTQLQPAAMVPCAKEENVSFAKSHTLSLFGGLEVFTCYSLAGFQPFDSF
jgi:hypothetical protein